MILENDIMVTCYCLCCKNGKMLRSEKFNDFKKHPGAHNHNRVVDVSDISGFISY